MDKNTKMLLKIFSLPILVLVVHVVLDTTYLYSSIDWTDDVMHFLGGISLGISYPLFLKYLQIQGFLGKMHKYIFFVFVISLISITAVGWEFFEFGLDIVYPRENLGSRQPSLPDTMYDLILGLTGGAIGFFIGLKYLKKIT